MARRTTRVDDHASEDVQSDIDRWVEETNELFGQYAAAFCSARELAEQILAALEKANEYFQAAGHATPQSLIMDKFAGALAKLNKAEQDEVMRWLRPALSQAAVGAIFGVTTKTVVGREARQRESEAQREEARALADAADNRDPAGINSAYGYNARDELGPDNGSDIDQAIREAQDAINNAQPLPSAKETEELKKNLRSWISHANLPVVRKRAMLRFLKEMLEQLERDLTE